MRITRTGYALTTLRTAAAVRLRAYVVVVPITVPVFVPAPCRSVP